MFHLHRADIPNANHITETSDNAAVMAPADETHETNPTLLPTTGRSRYAGLQKGPTLAQCDACRNAIDIKRSGGPR